MTCDALRQPLRGVGRVCETLLPELVRQGEAVVPLDGAENGYAARLAGSACAVLPFPRGPAKSARWYATLLRRLPGSGIEHDVLLSTAGFPHAFGAHPRLSVFVHDLHMLERGYYQPFKQLWFQALLRRGLERAALRVCVSHATKRELERRFPSLDPARNVVVYNAIAPRAPNRATGDGAHFLFVGQLERRKNLSRLLEAYAAARDCGVRTDLHLVGRPGPGGEEILARARSTAGVQVHTDADDTQLQRLYDTARAVLIPSLHEGFGLPVLEAMQAGAPVLASTGTALAEVAGEAAMLVDPTDVSAIRRGIVALDGDATLREELAGRGRARCRAFEPSQQAQQLRAALASIC